MSSAKHPWDFDDYPIRLPAKWQFAENFGFVFKYFVFNRFSVKANMKKSLATLNTCFSSIRRI